MFFLELGVYCIVNIIAFFMIALVVNNFFGYSITLTKKRVIIISIAMAVFITLNLWWPDYLAPVICPKLYEAFRTGIEYEGMKNEYDELAAYMTITQRLFFYTFAGICYSILPEGRRIRYAISADLLLFYYFTYSDRLIDYAYLYMTGGKWETKQQILYSYGVDSALLEKCKMSILFLFSSVLLVIMYFAYYRKKRSYIIRFRKRVLAVLWMMIFIFMPYDIMYQGNNVLEKRYTIMSFHFGWMIAVMGFIAPVILILVESAKYLKKENQFQKRYLEAELEYIERYKEAQQQTRAFRHDMINQLSMTNMLLEEGKSNQAAEQLQTLLGEIQALSQQFVTGDEMLDCIVSMKAEKMKEMGILFSADGVVDGGLNLKATEICSIFANALDNSIEAVEEIKDPKISMEIKKTEQFFVINIANSIREKVNVDKLMGDVKYTSKKDKDSHGFGFGNIKRVVENNNGFVNAKSLDDTFILSIMLPRTKQAS